MNFNYYTPFIFSSGRYKSNIILYKTYLYAIIKPKERLKIVKLETIINFVYPGPTSTCFLGY